MKNKKLVNLILAALFLGIGLVLPFVTGQIQKIGNMLLPMHIPVLLCGFICGPQYGILVGFILPLMRSAIFGMPVMYPNAVSMAFELAAYGFISGFLFGKINGRGIFPVYGSLLGAMLGGRIIWGIAQTFLLGIGGFTFKMFIAGAFVNAVPGIILQLILIPAVMLVLNKKFLNGKLYDQ
ncbi:MAG: ECF transporter S component [Ruminococcaceae bacterium]|nr:ECF transporter S component [Oscillospiraceae bacterium]